MEEGRGYCMVETRLTGSGALGTLLWFKAIKILEDPGAGTECVLSLIAYYYNQVMLVVY